MKTKKRVKAHRVECCMHPFTKKTPKVLKVPKGHVVEKCCYCGGFKTFEFDPRLDHGEYHD